MGRRDARSDDRGQRDGRDARQSQRKQEDEIARRRKDMERRQSQRPNGHFGIWSCLRPW